MLKEKEPRNKHGKSEKRKMQIEWINNEQTCRWIQTYGLKFSLIFHKSSGVRLHVCVYVYIYIGKMNIDLIDKTKDQNLKIFIYTYNIY